MICILLILFAPLKASSQSLNDKIVTSNCLDLREALGLSAAIPDTTLAGVSFSGDTEAVKEKLKSPLVAVLLSAVIPGGGQVYNGSYWKVPVIFGVQAFFVSQWISNNKNYKNYRSLYSQHTDSTALLSERDMYHDQRDSYAWYIAGVYLLSMLDAYVDAELSGFDVSPGLSVSPNGRVSVALSLKKSF